MFFLNLKYNNLLIDQQNTTDKVNGNVMLLQYSNKDGLQQHSIKSLLTSINVGEFFVPKICTKISI